MTWFMYLYVAGVAIWTLMITRILDQLDRDGFLDHLPAGFSEPVVRLINDVACTLMIMAWPLVTAVFTTIDISRRLRNPE